MCVSHSPQSHLMEFSVVVWPGGRSRVGSRCRSKVKLGAPPKPNAITLTPSVADIVMQHHRPLQIPITLKICRSVCKCAKVIWQMWKCRNVHLEGGTGGSCPALQRTNVLWDIWRAKWLQVKLALIQFFSIWCKNSQGLKKLFAFHLPAEEAAMRKMPSSS